MIWTTTRYLNIKMTMKVNQTRSDWQSEESEISNWQIWANECSESDQQNSRHNSWHTELV